MDASENTINLSELTDFQFGPAWARAEAAKPTYTELPRERRGGRDDRPRRQDGERRPFNRDNRERRAPRAERSERGERRDNRRNGDFRGERRQPRELPQPAEGYRVELRPANNILEIFAAKVAEQKRALPLLDLARVVMAGKDRYDIVFMQQENAAKLIHSRKADGACWLTKEEAVAYMHTAPWFGELYTTEQVETEAPKGTFSGVAVCTMGGEVIGPVNWHGYQSALMSLYRSKYANMPLEVFKSRTKLEKDEAAVAAWMEQASHKTVWKPVREGAAEVVLEDAHAVEQDFIAHHFDDVYETVDKVFINGATERKVLSPGLAAHVAILADKTRRFPQMLIPNLCHGMARHHMPIYKWHGNHYTGPSRVRAIPADTVLADRMMAMVNWSKENSGKKADEMFAALSGVPAGTDEATKQAAADAYAPYVADMIWLLEQGFIVVTSDNAVWFPKGETAPEPAKTAGKGKRKPAKKPAAKKDKPAKAAETPAEAPAEAPAETPAAE